MILSGTVAFFLGTSQRTIGESDRAPNVRFGARSTRVERRSADDVVSFDK
jgi:hypothetical protein